MDTKKAGDMREITLSEIIRRTEEANLPQETMSAFVDTLRQLPDSQRGQLNALNAYIDTTESAARRTLEENIPLRDRLEARVLETLEGLVEQHAQGADAAEGILQAEIHARYGNVKRLQPLSRMQAQTELRFIAHRVSAEMLDEKPILDLSAPLTQALRLCTDKLPFKPIYKDTVLASITWGQLHGEALQNGADRLLFDIRTNTEKAQRLIFRKCWAEKIEGWVVQQPIRFRDDTTPADVDALPPIPEDAEPFAGKKWRRYDRCQDLKGAWEEHGERIETKDQLHYEAGGDKVRMAVRRALEDVGWPVPTEVQEYVGAVQKLIRWHDERT